MNINSDDANQGLYEKFDVKRLDGSSAKGRKHENCRYFVLDLDHDPHAIPALAAYAESCATEFPQLAIDLRFIVSAWEKHRRELH